MEPVRFETRPAVQLLGLARRLDPQGTDWGALWRNEYAPRFPEIEARTSGDTCLGVYFPGATEGLVDFLAGRPMRVDTDVPAGLVQRELPAATYAVFECGMAQIGSTWQAVYSDWLPVSSYCVAADKACFEEFGPGCHEGRVPVRIYVPVVRRE